MPVWVRSRLRRFTLFLSDIETLTQHILETAGVPEAEVSLDLVGDRRMRRLNRHYRGIDRTTDVLAFAAREGPGPPSPLLGDVVVSVPQADRQAERFGASLDQEMTKLLVHGVLHLLGYDHEKGGAQANRMRRREDVILRSLSPLPRLVLTKGIHSK